MNLPFIILRVAVALLLLAAIADWEYSFYSLLRVLVTISAIECLWVARRRGAEPWMLAFGAIAVLWNPFVEVHLFKTAWMVLDALAAMVFFGSTVYLRRAATAREN
jgi:hypothetical protein